MLPSNIQFSNGFTLAGPTVCPTEGGDEQAWEKARDLRSGVKPTEQRK